MSGLTFQNELARIGVDLPVIFITRHGDIRMSVLAMKAGAFDFLTKPFRDQDVLDAIQAAIERDRESRRDAARIFGLQEHYATLTERERQIMGLVAIGRANKQIAAELDLSEMTVKVHRGQVMRKMLASSLPELVRMADRLDGVCSNVIGDLYQNRSASRPGSAESILGAKEHECANGFARFPGTHLALANL